MSEIDYATPPLKKKADPAPSTKAATVLKFSDNTGLKVGQTVNTFRVGDKWAGVNVDDVVQLANTEGEVFGEAVITGVLTGHYDDLASKFSSDNHAVLGQPALQTQPLLTDILRAVYPEFKGKKDKTVVLYFTRTK